MGVPRRQANPDSNDESADVKAVLALLASSRNYIEQKFAQSVGYEIQPSTIQSILTNIGILINISNDRNVKKLAYDIQDNCNAALVNFNDLKNRAEYFRSLRKILILLKKL